MHILHSVCAPKLRGKSLSLAETGENFAQIHHEKSAVKILQWQLF